MLGSPVDIAIVAGVILLIFGPKKVPEFGKALGQGIGNFKKALTDAQDEFQTAVHTEPQKTDASASPANPAAATPAASPATSATPTPDAPTAAAPTTAAQPESSSATS